MTSDSCFEGIKSSGELKPLSSPKGNLRRFPFSEGIIEKNFEYFDGRYIVGAITSDFSDWKEYGLWDELTKPQNFCELFGLDKRIILSFDINESVPAYVREHAHFSPKIFMDTLGVSDLIDRFDCGGMRHVTHREKEAFKKQLEKYFASVTPLNSYKGNFRVPEIWVGAPIPLRDISKVTEIEMGIVASQ